MMAWKARDGTMQRCSSGGSAPQRSSSGGSGSPQEPARAEMLARIKSLQVKPTDWSTRMRFLTRDLLMEHVMKTPSSPQVETEQDKIKTWFQKSDF
eukprot:401288-Rhodomonas_salina.1